LPNDFTSALVPFDSASLPRALSAAFAPWRMNTMFASVSGAADAVDDVSAAAPGAMLGAAAVVSRRVVSAAREASFLAHAPTAVTSMKSATVRVVDIATPSEEGEQK
jgi:hypothetical protein